MDYFQFKKEVENKKLKNAYIFAGTEIFLKRAAVEELVDIYVPKEVSQLNVSYIENDSSTKSIKDMCETLPFLSEKRIVVIRDISYIKDDSNSIKDFADYLSELNSDCCVVILAIEIPRAYSALKKKVTIVEFKQQSESILKKWLIDAAKKEDVLLKRDSADLLLQYCLNDMATLKNELNKLIIFAKESGSVINKEDVEHIVSKSIQYNVFKMIDYFEQGKFDQAYEMYEIINQEGGQSFALLGAITSRYRNVYYAKMLMSKGYRGDSLIKELSINRYAARSAVSAANRYSIDELNNIFKLLNDTDYNIKSGNVKENDAIRNLLLHLFRK